MEPLTKTEFCRRYGFKASALSNWIKRGKLSGDSLVTVNGKEMIAPEAATRQLGVTLDPGQALGNGAKTLAALDGAPEPEQSPKREPTEREKDLARLNAARADAQESIAAKARLALEKERGNWVHRDEISAELTRETAKLVNGFARWVEQDLPIELAPQIGKTPAETRALIRAAFRTERERITASLLAEAETIESTENADAA